MHDGTIELCGQIGSLIEPAAETAPREQGHRDHTRYICERRGVPLVQHDTERSGKRAPPLVFQRVDDLSQGAVVAAVGGAHIFPASRAHRAGEWEVERFVTARTARRQRRRDERIAAPCQRSPNRFRFSHNAFRLMPRIAAARVWLPRVEISVSSM